MNFACHIQRSLDNLLKVQILDNCTSRINGFPTLSYLFVNCFFIPLQKELIRFLQIAPSVCKVETLIYFLFLAAPMCGVGA